VGHARDAGTRTWSVFIRGSGGFQLRNWLEV
jgi:hypothetical protein